MVDTPTISIVFDFRTSDDERDVLERRTQTLLREMQGLEVIARARRVVDPEPPPGNLAGGGWLMGVLQAEVTPANAGKLCNWLQQKFGKQPIKLKVKGTYGEEYDIEVGNPDDFERVATIAQKLAQGKAINSETNSKG